MSDDIAAPPRRPELQQAFQHLVDVARSTPLNGVADARQRDLLTARETVARYGDVGVQPDLQGVSFTPVAAGGVPAEWVTSAFTNLSHRLVYIHGGGWRSGAAQNYRAVTATLAEQSHACVLAIDYRLAPEHPFPAGLDDCVSAYTWTTTHAPGSSESAHVPADRMYLVGDSAGGNLAVATCLRIAAAGGPMPHRLAVMAGTLDNAEQEHRVGLDDPICTPEQFVICNDMYVPAGHSLEDPFVSPVYATREMLQNFPPTLLQASSTESLAWDARRFATRLAEASVRVNLSIWPELPHVWHQFLGLFPEAHAALREIANHLRN